MKLSGILSERLRLWSPVKLVDLDLWQRMSLDQEIKFAKLKEENASLIERKNTAYEECNYLTLQSKRLRGGLRHIKRWCGGEIVTMNPRQILDAVVRMCDDALLTGESDGQTNVTV